MIAALEQSIGTWIARGFAVGLLWGAQPAPLERASGHYQRTEYGQAIEVLKSDSSPQALLISGKAWFHLGEFKKATEVLQRADQSDSEALRWLARAWGRRAEKSILVFTYAGRCRDALERAVKLDPRNTAAMSDLLEYYLVAPGFLGGGIEKAETLRFADAAAGHYARFSIARKRSRLDEAEQHLRRAAELDPARLIDLGRFLAQQGKLPESEAAFDRAPQTPRLLFARAQTYLEGKRNIDEARRLLRRYLDSPLTPDDPPRAEAERLLVR